MGMSTSMVAFREPDAEYQKHKKVAEACWAADVEVPEATAKYLGQDAIDMEDAEQGLAFSWVECKKMTTPYEDSDSVGLEVDLRQLPSGVVRLRFYNSW